MRAKEFFRRAAMTPAALLAQVQSVTLDADGRQSYAIVAAAGTTIRMPLDVTSPLLAQGDMVLLEQHGSAAAANYRIAGVPAGARPGAGLVQVYGSGVPIGGGTYQGGDIILGSLAGGNMFVEYATGNLYHRVGTDVYGVELPNGQQIVGLCTAVGGVWTPSGPNVYVTPSGVYVRNGTTNAIAVDGTNGIRLYSGATQRGWIKLDGSGWLAGSDKLAWDASGNVTLAGTVNASAGAFTGAVFVGGGAPYVVIDGANKTIYSSNYVAGTTGWMVLSTGAAEFNNVTVRGTVYATTGQFTGNIQATAGAFTGAVYVGGAAPYIVIDGTAGQKAIYSSNYVAGSAGWMLKPDGTIELGAATIRGIAQIGAGTPFIRIDGTSGHGWIESNNFTQGVGGWRIDSEGSAEFGNVIVRGEIRTAVFSKLTQSAVSGGLILAKSATTISYGTTVASPAFTLRVKTQDEDPPFAANDIVRLKNQNGEAWYRVDAGDGDVHSWDYTATWLNGSTGWNLYEGDLVVDYGASGQGYIQMAADGSLGASAVMVFRSHSGSPWSSQTTHAYVGTDGRLYAGNGIVMLDTTGITIDAAASDTWAEANTVKWIDGSSNYIADMRAYRQTTYNVGQIDVLSHTSGDTCIARIYADNDADATNSRLDVVNTGDILQLYSGANARLLVTSAGKVNVASALRVGDVTTDPVAALEVVGDMAYSGDLRPYRNSTSYTGYAFVPLTTPLTSTSWDGDARSATSKTLIDLSAVFGAPAGIKSVLVKAVIRDSGSASAFTALILAPNNTADSGLYNACSGLPNDYQSYENLTVPCDANGDIYYQVYASGAGTADVWLEIWGYWI